MTKVDTWLGTTYDIYVDDKGMYYICDCGAIVSPGFATLSAAQQNGFKYMKKDVKMTDKVNEFGCPVPIYEDYIIIQNHRNDLPDDMKLQEFADAGYWRDKDGQLHIWLSKDINPWRTIPHECVHIANRILAERDVVYFPTQDEALAYLVGFLCENVAEAYNELYKTDEQP